MDSASSVDSITALTKPSGQTTTLSYPLRKLLEGEHDRCGATDLQFSVHDHNTSGTSSAASSGKRPHLAQPCRSFQLTDFQHQAVTLIMLIICMVAGPV